MKVIYLKSALKYNPFDVTIVMKIPFFSVSVTIEPGRSLLPRTVWNGYLSLFLRRFFTFFWEPSFLEKFFFFNKFCLFNWSFHFNG